MAQKAVKDNFGAKWTAAWRKCFITHGYSPMGTRDEM